MTYCMLLVMRYSKMPELEMMVTPGWHTEIEYKKHKLEENFYSMQQLYILKVCYH